LFLFLLFLCFFLFTLLYGVCGHTCRTAANSTCCSMNFIDRWLWFP
jgi:hypothetical protein